MEDVLVKDGTFSLQRRKELLKSEAEYEVIFIDVTEMSIEHPQRTEKIVFPKEKKTYTEHPSVTNFLVNLISTLAAYSFLPKRPSVCSDSNMQEGFLCLLD